MLYMSVCTISACKSAIVSPYTPASIACVGCPHCLTSEPDCIITSLSLQIRQSYHYDDPRVNKLHNSRQHTQIVSPLLLLFFDHHNYDCFVKRRKISISYQVLTQ